MGVEGAKGLFIRLRPGGTPVTKTCFGFKIIEDGVVVTETPEVQAALNLGTNVPGLLDTVCHLEDHGDKHQGFLGVPLAEPDTEKFVVETLEKRFADPPLWDQVALGGKLHHPFPSALPDEIVRNISQEMGSWVGVDVSP